MAADPVPCNRLPSMQRTPGPTTGLSYDLRRRAGQPGRAPAAPAHGQHAPSRRTTVTASANSTGRRATGVSSRPAGQSRSGSGRRGLLSCSAILHRVWRCFPTCRIPTAASATGSCSNFYDQFAVFLNQRTHAHHGRSTRRWCLTSTIPTSPGLRPLPGCPGCPTSVPACASSGGARTRSRRPVLPGDPRVAPGVRFRPHVQGADARLAPARPARRRSSRHRHAVPDGDSRSTRRSSDLNGHPAPRITYKIGKFKTAPRLLRAAGFRDVRAVRRTAVRGRTEEPAKFTGGRCPTERPPHYGRDADGREPVTSVVDGNGRMHQMDDVSAPTAACSRLRAVEPRQHDHGGRAARARGITGRRYPHRPPPLARQSVSGISRAP